ncbi:E3 ubiquitin/ISG15 ligase TRIM25-like isoform X1 [Scyliorhinus torazame]
MDPGALKDVLTCAVCLQVYQDPVTLPCQHSFCLKCIEGVWTQRAGPEGFECPQCHQKFNSRSKLERCFTLGNTVEKHELQLPGDSACVLCEHCVENPTKAVKTCLKCETSFCSLHLKSHLVKEAYKDHALIEPAADLRHRQCLDHKKLLEFYCKDDAECVCVSCTIIGKHKSHTLLSLDQAQSEIKEEYEREIEKLRDDQQNCSSKQRDLERREAEIKTQINELKGKLSKSFSEWRRKLEEDEESTLKLIDEEGLRALSKIRSCSEALNKRMEQITLIDGETQSVAQMDPLSFIQNSKRLLSRVTETQKVTDPDVPAFTLNLSHISQLIQKRLNGWERFHSDILRIIMSASTKYRGPSNITRSPHSSSGAVAASGNILQPSTGVVGRAGISDGARSAVPANAMPAPHSAAVTAATDYRGPSNVTSSPHNSSGAVAVAGNILQPSTGMSGSAGISEGKSSFSLDPKTANCNLVLSDDLRSVTWTEQKQPYPAHPGRFKDRPQVLCSQSFSSGSHSWDVETNGDYWVIGIVSKSAEREGENSGLGNSNKSWCIYCGFGSLWARHNSHVTRLRPFPSNNRIRVRLNYNTGILTFYEVTDLLINLHTFKTKFTEPVFPAFYCRYTSLKLLNSF